MECESSSHSSSRSHLAEVVQYLDTSSESGKSSGLSSQEILYLDDDQSDSSNTTAPPSDVVYVGSSSDASSQSFQDDRHDSLNIYDPQSGGFVDRKCSQAETEYEYEELHEEERVSMENISTNSQESMFDAQSGKLHNEMWNPLEVMHRECCPNHCMQRLLTMQDVIITHYIYMKVGNHHTRRQFILDSLINNSAVVETGVHTSYIIRGVPVCLSAWLLAHNISRKSFRQIFTEFRKGTLSLLDTSPRKGWQSVETGSALAWMRRYFDLIGDKLPDICRIHLPSFMTKLAVYNNYCKEEETRSEVQGSELKIICSSQFYRLWCEFFSHVKIPPENRLTKCNICVALKEEKEKTMDPELRSQIDDLFLQHNSVNMDERGTYFDHRELARGNPDKYMTAIIDGMDQNKLSVPRLSQIRKASAQTWLMRIHLTGVLVHGSAAYGFFDFLQYAHDSNLTMNILLQVLLMHPSCIPDIFFLQMDNCYRENKNRFVFAFCGYLVQSGIFKEIYINFLLQGHTHEDIDQVFSVLSKEMKGKDFISHEDLMDKFQQILQSGYSQDNSSVHVLSKMFDIREWIRPFAVDLHNHSIPHAFKIALDIEGNAVLHYKMWSRDAEWLGGNGLKLLKEMPTGELPLLNPSGDKMCLDKLKEDIPKLINHSAVRMVTQAQKEKWTTFLNQTLPDLIAVPGDYTRENFPIEALLAKKRHTEDEDQPSHGLSQDLVDMHKRVLHIDPNAKVYSGTKRQKKNMETTPASGTGTGGTNDIGVGDFIAADMAEWSERPLIGVVRLICDDDITVHWYRGSWSTKWKPCKKRVARAFTDWEQKIKKTDIVFAGFKLTRAGNLPLAVKSKLKELYGIS